MTAALVVAHDAALGRATIAHHSKSFALATRLLPAATGDQAAMLYAWCRRADDAVDLVPTDEAPVAAARLAGELDRIYAGEPPTDAVLASFAHVVATARIPAAYPRALIAGMASDAAGPQIATVDDVLHYSYRVASTVGLMMCHVFGVRDDRALRRAAHLGIAMQLTNIARDVAEDYARGRVYLPRTLAPALHAACARGEPLVVVDPASVAEATYDLLALADRYYASGDRGIGALPWRAGVAIAAARSIYARIGARIRARGCNPMAGRAVVPGWQKRALAALAVTRRVVALPAHAVLHVAGRVPRAPSIVVEADDVVRL